MNGHAVALAANVTALGISVILGLLRAYATNRKQKSTHGLTCRTRKSPLTQGSTSKAVKRHHQTSFKPKVNSNRSARSKNLKFRKTSSPPLGIHYPKIDLTDIEYTTVKILDTGAFGTVRLVTANKCERMLVIKTVDPTTMVDHRKKQFVWERQILQELSQHTDLRYIVEVVHIFTEEPVISYVCEYYELGTLRDLLSYREVFTNEMCAIYSAEIACALMYLHNNGIVHRDVKPDNILIDREMHLRLTDLGMSRKLGPGEKTRSICGTPHYMAREMLVGASYDFSADWWSLGIVTYEMLLGKRPFDETDMTAFLTHMLRTDVVECPEDIPVDVVSFIGELLISNPKYRLGSCDNGHEELKAHPFYSDRFTWSLIQDRSIEIPVDVTQYLTPTHSQS